MGNLKFGTYSPTALYMGASGSTKAYLGTTEVFSGGSIDYSKEYLTFEILTGGTINWIISTGGSDAAARTISYSINGGSWTDITSSTSGTSFNVAYGDIVRFKGDTLGTSSGVTDASSYSYFRGSTAYYNAYGNIMSLASSTAYTTDVQIVNGFKGLFRETNIIDASNLYLPQPLVAWQYRFLFRDCASLITMPHLEHFERFPNYCCAGMFSNCSSLTNAENNFAVPLATIVGSYAFREMYSGCTSLNYVKCLSEITNINYYHSWLSGVSSTGTFVKDPNASWTTGVNGIPAGWHIVGEIEVLPTSLSFDATGGSETISVTSDREYAITPDVDWITGLPAYGSSGTSAYTATAQANTGDSRTGHITFNALTYSYTVNVSQGGGTPPGPAYDEMYMTFDILSGGTIVFSKTGNGNDLAIEYDFSDDDWQTVYGSDATSINVSAGDKVRFRGYNATYSPGNLNNWCSFTSGTCEFNVYGNIMSMIEGDNFYGSTLGSTVRPFAHLFEGCSGLRSAEHLVLPENLANGAYNSTFKDCINLTTAPELPATSVTYTNCYANMFNGCTSLDYIKCYAQIINNGTTGNWVLGVAANGTFWADINASWSTGDNGIPDGWTVEYI